MLEPPVRGHALIRKHKKTFLDNTTLHHALCHGLGQALFEVGGRNKSRAQLPKASRSEYLVKDDILVGSRRILPLYFHGFFY